MQEIQTSKQMAATSTKYASELESNKELG